MWLLDNRVQSPSGSGYALENRIVMANVFPQLNKNIHRGKLGPYFSELQKQLENLVPTLKIKMWFFIAWSRKRNHFEHVYLSSYLGFKLVGSDLLVREGFVWLKRLTIRTCGCIIKRIDDQWCDPLELNKIHY
jgi:uncharacterized circularly permuted ATP-grasp superfamily protein